MRYDIAHLDFQSSNLSKYLRPSIFDENGRQNSHQLASLQKKKWQPSSKSYLASFVIRCIASFSYPILQMGKRYNDQATRKQLSPTILRVLL